MVKRGFLNRISEKGISNPLIFKAFQPLNKFLGALQLKIMSHYNSKEVIKLIDSLRKEDVFLFKPSELLNIHSFAKYCSSLNGDYIEVGVYRGTSAKVISEAIKSSKTKHSLYLFDTFEGIPDTKAVDKLFWKGQFKSEEKITNLEFTKERLKKYRFIKFYPGIFPQNTGDILKNKKIAFAHLDVDVHKSTLDALNIIYPKLVSGGIIISHDYGQAKGVKKAFDNFFSKKPESIIKLPMSQCMIIKK